jgi:CRP-like cAMP-binding protein
MLSLKGSWPSRLLAVSQVCVGIAALLGVVGMATRRPILMLAFTAATGLIVLGVVLFAVVALTAQRGMIREDYGAGDVIVSAGEGRPDVYVISSGTVEIVSTRPDGGEEVKERLSAGAHFHGTALPGGAARNATARAATPVVVMKMTPAAFRALCASFPLFKDHFEDVVRAHARESDART